MDTTWVFPIARSGHSATCSCSTSSTAPTTGTSYQEVNSKFAHAVADEVQRSPEKPIVWIQDYHFALAAEMLRELATPALIHQFWHIPFPPADILRLLPTGVDEALLRGLLGNDLIEFHTERYALNFLGCVAELVPEAEIDADTLSIHYDGRRIDVGDLPDQH